MLDKFIGKIALALQCKCTFTNNIDGRLTFINTTCQLILT